MFGVRVAGGVINDVYVVEAAGKYVGVLWLIFH